MKDLKDLRELSIEDLKKEFKSANRNLFELKMKKSLDELKQTHLIKDTRRYIARIKTLMNNQA